MCKVTLLTFISSLIVSIGFVPAMGSEESEEQEGNLKILDVKFEPIRKGKNIVEVYNEREQLDPYHETTHILMHSFGNPPALFNEGFAVYMSERLGAYALDDLSGGQATIYERVRELKTKGEWIELEELITYNEIGLHESRPPVAYAEAASFVKFLIDEYGKDKFLQTYKNLKNSNNKIVHQTNKIALQKIYSKQLSELQKEWENAFQKEQ